MAASRSFLLVALLVGLLVGGGVVRGLRLRGGAALVIHIALRLRILVLRGAGALIRTTVAV